MGYRLISPRLFVIGILLWGCEDSSVVSNPETLSLVYSTSFESSKDTAGWRINGRYYDEGAPLSGSKSLLLNMEDATYGSTKILPIVGEDTIYRIQFFGRTMGRPGKGRVRIVSANRIPPPLIDPPSIDFYDSTWGFYTVKGSIPTGREIMVQCIGFWPGTEVLVDDIRIFTVKP